MADKKKKRAYKKSARIRKAIREEKQVSEADLEWLKAYEAAKVGGVEAAVDEATGDDAGDEGDEGDEGDDAEPASGDGVPGGAVVPPVDSAEGGGAGAADERPPPPPPVAPPPPRGPRPSPMRPGFRTKAKDDDDAPSGGRAEPWQKKYKKEGKAAGREQTVLMIAGGWMQGLEMLCAKLREVQVEPFVEPKDLFPSIVLTLDDMLPASLELKPEHIAVGGSTALLVQAVMNRKALKSRMDADKATNDLKARTEARKAAASAKADAPRTAPPSSSEPVREPDSSASSEPSADRTDDVPRDTHAEPIHDAVARNGAADLSPGAFKAFASQLVVKNPEGIY